MSDYSNKMTDASANGMDAFLKLCQVSLSATERFVKLQAEVSKEIFDYNAAVIKELSSPSRGHDAFAVVSQLSNEALERVLNRSRAAYQILEHSQSELASVASESADSAHG